MNKIAIAAVIAAAIFAAAQWYFSDRGRFTTEPEFTDLKRTISGNILVSTQDPAAELHFDPVFNYIGGQKFILYGVADTEQHFFVETRADGRLKSVYWIQYEAYLPGKPYTYDYSDQPLRVNLGAYEFLTDTAAFHNDPQKKRRRGTDGTLVRQFLASKGLVYPDEVIYARMVYLTDESRQKELMIIFMDDLADYGYTAAELQQDGRHRSQWAAIEQAHLDRIKETLSAYPLAEPSESAGSPIRMVGNSLVLKAY